MTSLFAMMPVVPASERIAAVTGANKGVGFFIALHLATSGLFGHIVIGCRDRVRGKAAVADILDQGKGK